MAELKHDEEEHELPSKRKPIGSNPSGEDLADDLGKKQKLDSPNSNSAPAEEKTANENDDEEDGEEDYEDEDDADSDSDDDEDEDEDGDEESSEEAVIDRKGKGIMKGVKGKGKLIEESDDSSNVASESDGDDSDLSDDPLAEVDLDNILPSRTRRRVVRPGINITGEGKHDDSDA